MAAKRRVWAAQPIYDDPPPVRAGEEITGRFPAAQLQQLIDQGAASDSPPADADAQPAAPPVRAKTTVKRTRSKA